MKIAVVYESMFGNTHQISEAIAEGAGRHAKVVLLPVHDADADALAGADVLVVGGPTHAFALSTPSSRDQAAAWSRDPSKNLTLDAEVPSPGMREWLADAGQLPVTYAAFDTRVDFLKVLPGAAGAMDKALRLRKGKRLAPARSFAVTKDSELKPGERERAVAWGEQLVELAAAALETV